MKSIGIIAGLLILLSGCGSTQTKPEEMDRMALNHGGAGTYQTAEKYYQAGQFKQAKAGFELVLEEDSEHIEAHFRLGNIALRNKQLEEAKIHYETVLKRDRRHTKSHYNLGVIYLMQAERYFQYFTATKAQNNNHPRLLKLLASINQFSANNTHTQNTQTEENRQISTKTSIKAAPMTPEKTEIQSKPSPAREVDPSLDRLTELLSDDGS